MTIFLGHVLHRPLAERATLGLRQAPTPISVPTIWIRHSSGSARHPAMQQATVIASSPVLHAADQMRSGRGASSPSAAAIRSGR